MLRIFTEGRDEVFIRIFLEHLGYLNDIHFSTNSTGGWNKIHAIEPKIREYQDNGDTVVLVFDADDPENDGGFAARLAALNTLLAKENLTLDIFLFPNHSNDGDFESLMAQCAATGRQGVFRCFGNYENCVNRLTTATESFRTPLRKSRFYAYFECIDEPNATKEKERRAKSYFFDKSKYWNLDSPFLTSLRDFLITRI